MGASADAIGKAASEYPDLRPYLPGGADLPDVRTLEDFVGALERAEQSAGNAYRKLVAMADAGLDKQSDYFIYAELQNAIYKAQISAINLVIAVADAGTGGVAGIALRPLLTPPSPMPAMTWSGRHESQALRGLGIAPALAVAGVILAALAALGLMYLYTAEISRIVDDLTTVYVAHARAAQQTELLEARRVAFEACRSRGGDEADCRAEALELNPTPREAGTDIPDAPGADRRWTWGQIGLAVAGGVVVVAVLGGLFLVARQSLVSGRGFGGYHGHPVSRVGPLPKMVSDLGGRSSYNLEVRRGR